jgi:hypothetical protein
MVGQHAVPGGAVSRVPAVTVRGSTVTLWSLDPPPAADAGKSGHADASFGPEAVASWKAAVVALPRSLPVLWRDLRDEADRMPCPRRIGLHLTEPGIEQRERVVDGGSFGLAFLLHLASRVLSLPCPPDILASVAIDELGRASRVDGLPQKLAGIAEMDPQITRVLVAAPQHEEVGAAAAGRLQLVPVRTAAQALEIVFGEALGTRLAEAGSDDARRRELVDAFFRLALVGRGAAVDWSPVERGAAIALREWPMAFDDRYRLQFAAGIAARHERNAGEVVLPGSAWLDSQPAPIRVAILTHLVQQCADTGTPPVADIEPFAARQLPADLGSAFVPQLKLAGAVARLWAVTGRAADALEMQQRVARAFVAIFEEGEVSFQLSEWFRLSGALEDADAFAAADALLARLDTIGCMSAAGKPYVELSRARARVQLGTLDRAVAERLDRLSSDLSVPAHVRWSAHRWVVRAWRGLGEKDRAAEGLSDMLRNGRTVPHALRYLVLAGLDADILEHRAAAEDVRAGIARLRDLDPGPMGHLEAAYREPADIIRFYPY